MHYNDNIDRQVCNWIEIDVEVIHDLEGKMKLHIFSK